MFRSRANEKDMAKRHGNMAKNKDVSVPLVHTQDGRDFDPKRKPSHDTISGNEEEAQSKEAVQAQESKRRKRRIMKIAVYFMFGIIAIGVFAIWLFHKDSVESLRFDSDFIFTVKLRSLEVKNSDGEGVLYGDMGRNLLATPYDHCWDDQFDSYEENCLYWRKFARLRVARDVNSTSSCYTLRWEGLKDGFHAEDCFYLQRFHWFGYVTNTTPIWPITDLCLKDTQYYPAYPKGRTDNLVPIWFGSQGVSIFVDSSYPFSTSWNTTDKRQFCIKSTRAATGSSTDLIAYTICQGESLDRIYSVTQRHRQESEAELFMDTSQLGLLPPKPIMSVLSKEDVPGIISEPFHNNSDCSLFEIFDEWENEYGDLEIDLVAKPELDDLLAYFSSQNCKPILPISTFFSYQSKHFSEGVGKGFYVKDNLNLATRMVKWRGQEGAVLDVSNALATEWFLGHVSRLVYQYNIKALKLLHIDIPLDSTFNDLNVTCLDYTWLFYQDMSSLNISLVQEITSGYIPLLVHTPIKMPFNGEEGSACMNTTVPQTFIMGMSGFPMLIAIMDEERSSPLTEERFMRWLQLAIFFPVLKMRSIPLLKEANMRAFLHEALTLREKELLPYIAAVRAEEPDDLVIRPMWWIDPKDDQALTINDQFMIGNHLLVAPALCEGMTARQVYLPKGTWQRAGMKPVQGPQTVEVLTKSFNTIPYFWRQMDEDENM